MESNTKDSLNQKNSQTWALLLPFNYDVLATGQEQKSQPAIKTGFIQLEIHKICRGVNIICKHLECSKLLKPLQQNSSNMKN